MFEVNKNNEVTWRFENSNLFPHTFKIEFSTCPDTFCPLELITAIFSNEIMTKAFTLVFDVVTHKIKNESKTQENKQFLKTIKKEISNVDWQLLFDEFIDMKLYLTQKFDPKNCNVDDIPDFNKADIEEGILQEYSAYFLWDKKITISIGEINYLIMDKYCLGSNC